MVAQKPEGKYVVVEAWYSFPGRKSFLARFKTMEEVLPGYLWVRHECIDGYMKAMKTTDVDYCLSKLNDHWTPAQLQQLLEE